MILFAKGLVIHRYSIFATVGKIPPLPPQKFNFSLSAKTFLLKAYPKPPPSNPIYEKNLSFFHHSSYPSIIHKLHSQLNRPELHVYPHHWQVRL